MVMVTLTVGQLMKPRESTICWREQQGLMPKDMPVLTNDLLILCDSRTFEVIPGLHTVRVLHPKHGLVTCILDELVPVNQPQTCYS